MKWCLVLLLSVWPASAAETCHPKLLRPEVLRLVKPLLELRIADMRDSVDEKGLWKGKSAYADEVERRFEKLLTVRTRVGDEALAYLLSVYMGEHPGEELVCEITNRGKRMLRLVDTYAKCLPLTGLEPYPESVRGSGALSGYAKKGILSGKGCAYEQ